MNMRRAEWRRAGAGREFAKDSNFDSEMDMAMYIGPGLERDNNVLRANWPKAIGARKSADGCPLRRKQRVQGTWLRFGHPTPQAGILHSGQTRMPQFHVSFLRRHPLKDGRISGGSFPDAAASQLPFQVEKRQWQSIKPRGTAIPQLAVPVGSTQHNRK